MTLRRALVAAVLAGVLVAVLATRSGWLRGGSDDAGVGSLADAVGSDDLSRVQDLLAAGVDPDEPRVNGFSPLMRAAIRDNPEMVRLLVDHGASLSATTPGKLTAWHVAAEANAPAALRELIAVGVDLSVRSANGMNTLEHAAAGNGHDTIPVIAATGVDLDAQSEIITQGHGYPADVGSTALGIAAREGHVESIEVLLGLGVDVDAKSARGQTPLLVAVVAGQPPAVISLLLDAGADPTVRVGCVSRCAFDEADALGWARRLGDPAVIPLLEAELVETGEGT